MELLSCRQNASQEFADITGNAELKRKVLSFTLSQITALNISNLYASENESIKTCLLWIL